MGGKKEQVDEEPGTLFSKRRSLIEAASNLASGLNSSRDPRLRYFLSRPTSKAGGYCISKPFSESRGCVKISFCQPLPNFENPLARTKFLGLQYESSNASRVYIEYQ